MSGLTKDHSVATVRSVTLVTAMLLMRLLVALKLFRPAFSHQMDSSPTGAPRLLAD
jgi:hypothetical protein